tara:strand:- start:77 stop:1387 length:1311 start_codon:yes stop_codon:yes gene_type:complete
MTKRYLGNIITQNPTAPVPTARPSTLGSAKGVWSLNEAFTYQKAGQWPYPVFAPDAPTIGTATAGNATATVPFTAPSEDGGLDITQYMATSSPNSTTGVSSSSPITVTGLTNGTSYTFTVTATSAAGTGTASSSSNSVSPVAPAFAIIGGGITGGGARNRDIEKFDITSTGNAVDFGDLTDDKRYLAACGNTTRILFAGGDASSGVSRNIDYVSPTSGGQAANFGTMTNSMEANAALANSTRGIIVSGSVSGNTWGDIVYVTISSTGNASNFNSIQRGSLNGFKYNAACGSSTRGIFGGGQGGGSATNTIRYLTIGTTGEATDFGDLTVARYQLAATSSPTRGLFAGGNTSSNTIDYVTIASTGNAIDFGNLLQNKNDIPAGSSSHIRACFSGGISYSSKTIDAVTIASTGNAFDFGDLSQIKSQMSGTSNGHGGL